MNKTISELMQEYRAQKAVVSADETILEDIRKRVELALSEAGMTEWKDGEGYVRTINRAPSISYTNKDVDNLVQSWLQSEDPIMQSCGRMLQSYRTEKPASTYLQFK